MNNKKIIKATLIAALSISFLFNEPSFASGEEEKPLEANSQSLASENEATTEKKEEAKSEESFDKENEQKKEDENKDKAPALETSLKEDKSDEKEGKSTEDTHKADLNKDSSIEEKKDDKAVDNKDEGRVIYIAEFKDKEAGDS